MGLIKAIGGAIGGTLKDQWLDLIKCDNMDMDTLMVKQTTKTGQISKGSRIIVAPGQAVVIYDSGVVLDASAEEGVYTFDESSSPSFFGGQFGPVFKEMWQRFTYGGTPAKEQAIFFFNIKEILACQGTGHLLLQHQGDLGQQVRHRHPDHVPRLETPVLHRRRTEGRHLHEHPLLR